jgi:chemotaxis protein MotB
MALMMTFFILLYSMSHIDEKKYNSIVQSLYSSFHPAWLQKAQGMPSEFKLELMLPNPAIYGIAENKKTEQALSQDNSRNADALDTLYKHIAETMRKEIEDGMLILERNGPQVVIRFQDNVAFEIGSDVLSERMVPVVQRLSVLLENFDGQIFVSGHTDDLPILTERFRSNWELSAARSISVVTQLLKNKKLDARRIVASGHADTQPLAPNNTSENRAKNRRVEVRLLEFDKNATQQKAIQ